MKTTSRHYEVYFQECQKWINRYSLNSWEGYFKHGVPTGYENVLSAMSRDFESHSARFYFNTEWSEPITHKAIQVSARHEVRELLLYPLAKMAGMMFNDTQVNGATHDIINRLEGAL